MFYKNTAKDFFFFLKKKERKRKKEKRENHWESINLIQIFTSTQLKRKRANSEAFLAKKERGEKNHTMQTNAISKYPVLLSFKPTETKCVIRRLVQLP